MDKSLPVRGAWIEIDAYLKNSLKFAGRSPCGERGLKLTAADGGSKWSLSLPVRGAWIEIVQSWYWQLRRRVAPRAGSVD